MKKLITIGLALIITGIIFPQNMRENAYFSLFSDQKANKLGDAITIIVSEASQASNDAETSTSRKSDVGLDATVAMGAAAATPKALSIGTNNSFTGNGSTKTTGMINTKISATIDSVLPNGNLIVKGSRKIVINGEEQLITVKGIVRQSDIQADNSVQSYNISEAEFVFQGNGSINDNQKPGWITKFLHWIF
jgi:flagellar L-ring protein precursor FlgH